MLTDNTKLIVDLIAQLNAGNSQMRRTAARELVKLGTPAVEPLMCHLRNEIAGGRENAAWALGEICDPRCIDILFQALGDENPAVGKRTLEALSKLGVSPWKKVHAAIKDMDPVIRRWAVRSLAAIGCRRAAGPLIAVLNDKNTDIATQRDALAALQKIGTWHAKRYLRHQAYVGHKQSRMHEEDEKSPIRVKDLIADFRDLNVEDAFTELLSFWLTKARSAFTYICLSIIKFLHRLFAVIKESRGGVIVSRVILCPICGASIQSILRRNGIHYCKACTHIVSHCSKCAGYLDHNFIGLHLYRGSSESFRRFETLQDDKHVICNRCFTRMRKGDTSAQANDFLLHLSSLLGVLPIVDRQCDALGEWLFSFDGVDLRQKVNIFSEYSLSECVTEVRRIVRDVLPWKYRGCDVAWWIDKYGVLFCCFHRTNVTAHEDLSKYFFIARIAHNAYIPFDCTYLKRTSNEK